MGEDQHSLYQPATRKTGLASHPVFILFFCTASNQSVGPGIEVTVNIPYLLDIKRSTPNLASPLSAEIEDPTRGEKREILT